ncbi:MAG: preprotein translocase subunit SecY, partial [Mucinivorans sp.]
MKKFIETIRNIFKIEELRRRILYTLGILLIYRLGSFVVIPGINPSAIGQGPAPAGDNGILGLLDI